MVSANDVDVRGTETSHRVVLLLLLLAIVRLAPETIVYLCETKVSMTLFATMMRPSTLYCTVAPS